MQYEDMCEQEKVVVSILKKNKKLMEILDYVAELGLNDFYLAAGCIFQTIWNYYDGKDLNFGIKDIDIIYYDSSDLSVDVDLEYYKIINRYAKSKHLDYEIDVSNEARMHLWKMERESNLEVCPYKNSCDAIMRWIATVHAIGITKVNGDIKVYAPYGLSDIFSRTIRPIKHEGNSQELYEKKVLSWQERFSDLRIVPW